MSITKITRFKKKTIPFHVITLRHYTSGDCVIYFSFVIINGNILKYIAVTAKLCIINLFKVFTYARGQVDFYINGMIAESNLILDNVGFPCLTIN